MTEDHERVESAASIQISTRPGDRRRPWLRSRAFRFGAAVAVVATIVTSIVLALAYSGQAVDVPALDLPAPRLHLSNVLPGAPAISDVNLQGPAVVVNFWGSWCPPCQAEMPLLEATHRRLGDRVTFIGIDEGDSRAAAVSFLHKVGVTYLVGFDGNGGVERAFSLDDTPVTFWISHGRELDFTLGQLTKTSLRMNLQQWFGVS